MLDSNFESTWTCPQPQHWDSWGINMLQESLVYKDLDTKKHSDRLSEPASELGRKVGLNSRELRDLRLFARFHDLGKIMIPNRVLFKEGALSKREWDIIKMHTVFGSKIAASIRELRHLSGCILTHHERWDGSGYPEGLRGLEIPLFCRILAITDAWDAMTNDRCYRRALSPHDAMRELEINAGSQFDPTLVEIWRNL